MNDRADRYNDHKPRMDLLPWDVLLELAHHYRIGAQKYAERNWEKGLPWNSGTAASLARHLAKWSQGEDIDPENGQFHDIAILWNACALVAYRLRGVGVDDRPLNGPRTAEPDRPKNKETYDEYLFEVVSGTTSYDGSTFRTFPGSSQPRYSISAASAPGCPGGLYNGPRSPSEGRTEGFWDR